MCSAGRSRRRRIARRKRKQIADLRQLHEAGEIEWRDLSTQRADERAFLEQDDDAEPENLSDDAALSTTD